MTRYAIRRPSWPTYAHTDDLEMARDLCAHADAHMGPGYIILDTETGSPVTAPLANGPGRLQHKDGCQKCDDGSVGYRILVERAGAWRTDLRAVYDARVCQDCARRVLSERDLLDL